jgi:hypothetical protein
VKSLALPQNRKVVVLSVDLNAAPVNAGTPVSVNLSNVDNVVGIANYGKAVINKGLDASGYAYSASLLGSSVTWGGSTFSLGAAGSSDAASKTTIALPAAHGSTVKLLATAVNGSQPNQTFLVTYSDGTTTSFYQSLSDWYSPHGYSGESKASTMAYRIAPSGVTNIGPVYLYGYAFSTNSAKTLKSITLPNNRNVVVLAVDVSTASGSAAAPVHVNLGAVDNVVGIASNGSPATNGGLDGGGNSYSANLTGASISWSGETFTLGGSGTTPPPSGGTLTISGTPANIATAGGFYSFTPTVVATAGSSLTYAVAGKPTWAQFSAATGTLSGTPAAANVATDPNIVVSVSNGTKSAALPAFSIAVEAAVTVPAGSVNLSWSKPAQNTNGSPLTNLAGFIVRYGTNAAALSSQISVGSANSTSAQIANLKPGTWYFEVAAINTANVASPPSAMASKTVP